MKQAAVLGNVDSKQHTPSKQHKATRVPIRMSVIEQNQVNEKNVLYSFIIINYINYLTVLTVFSFVFSSLTIGKS